MIIAIIGNDGHVDVFNSATGKIVSGAVASAFERQLTQPDRRLDLVIGLLETLIEKVDQMSQSQDALRTEVADLKTNMTDLHTVLSAISARQEAALAAAAGGTTDPAILSDLHGVNTDLKSVIAGLRPADASSAPQPVENQPTSDQSDTGAAVVSKPEFNAGDTTPNTPGGRNTSGLPGFDPNQPETT